VVNPDNIGTSSLTLQKLPHFWIDASCASGLI
jgi:hypothetical protein